MAVQLTLFDAGEVRKARRAFAVDVEARRKRREARAKFIESSRMIPAIEAFVASGGEVGAWEPSPPEKRDLTRRERLELRKALKANRKSQKARARRIFALQDLRPDWIGKTDIELMAREIQRAAAELQRLWSENERRKRQLGLNASERDPNEHWSPPFASLGLDTFGEN